jgi:hypothetical protein
MASLAPADIVAIWETGGRRPDWSKALIALGPLFPDVSPSDLAALSVGERNAHLLALREGTIGPVMHALVKCAACGEPLEFDQRIDEWLDGYSPPAAYEAEFIADGYAVRYRLLTSEDLAHAAAHRDEARARQALIQRAVIEATHEGVPVAVSELPAETLDLLARDMAERDLLANLAIPLACAACGHVWEASLEIVSFLWAELDRKAKAILEDVVTIAHAYGWSETAILEMSPARRQYYLEAIG